MTSNRQPTQVKKKTMDVSTLIATVIAGQATIEALTQLFDICNGCAGLSKHWPYVCQAIIVIVTTIRFFHGNVMWYLWDATITTAKKQVTSTRQEIANKLSHYYIHIFQYLLFYAAGKSIGNTHLIIRVFMLISTVDVIWTGYNWLHERDPSLKRALASWFLINFITAIVLIILTNIDFSNELYNSYSYILFTLYIVGAIIDYSVNPELFFGIKSEIQNG